MFIYTHFETVPKHQPVTLTQNFTSWGD